MAYESGPIVVNKEVFSTLKKGLDWRNDRTWQWIDGPTKNIMFIQL